MIMISFNYSLVFQGEDEKAGLLRICFFIILPIVWDSIDH
jgi:hypothetical protein